MKKTNFKRREYKKPFVGMTVIEMEAQLLAGSDKNGHFNGGNNSAEDGGIISDAKDSFFDEED